MNAVWGDQWGQLRIGVSDGVEIVKEEGAVLGVMKHPSVTSGAFAA